MSSGFSWSDRFVVSLNAFGEEAIPAYAVHELSIGVLCDRHLGLSNFHV